MTFDPEGIFDGTPVAVRQQRRPLRPEQEHHLPDRPQRHADRRLHPDDRRAFVDEVQPQPHGDPGPAGAGPVVPERADRRQRDQLDLAARSPRSTSTRAVYSPGQVISNSTLPTGVTQTDLGVPVVTHVLTNHEHGRDDAAVDTGPIVGLTARTPTTTTRSSRSSPTSARRPAGGIPAAPGYSGVQGSDGDLLIGQDRRQRRTLAARRIDRHAAGGHHAVPPVRGHRLRPVRLLLAGRRPDGHERPRPAAAATTSYTLQRTADLRRQPLRQRPGVGPVRDRHARRARCRPRPSSCPSRARASSA